MSASTSPAAARGCTHCDPAVPHEHVDLPAVVAAARRRAARTASLQVLLTLVALGAVAAATRGGTTLLAVPAAAAAWLAVTGVGLVVAGTVRRRSGPGRAVLAGALTTAALVPVASLAVALLLPGGWLTAAGAAAGWLAATAGAAAVRTRAWRRVLVTAGREGDQARQAALADRDRRAGRDVGVWAVQGLAAGLAVAVLGPLPVAVAVLVPLAVVLAVVRVRAALAADR